PELPAYRETWAEVDVDAIAHNVRCARAQTGEGVMMMAVVKANAYGHGALPVARASLAAGASWLGVATLDEALQLRQAGLTAPILVLGYVDSRWAAVAVRHQVTLSVVSVEHAQALSATGEPVCVHLKLDTGMGRLGVRTDQELAAVEQILQTSRMRLTGAFTHFAQADAADKSHARRQLQQARAWFSVLQAHSQQRLTFHSANSAAIFRLPESHLDMVRLGISLYGVAPADDVLNAGLRQALRLYTRVAMVKHVPAGTEIGYGSTFVTTQATTVATLPIGYADGLPRVLSNRGYVQIRGQRCPIVGRVCMDQIMVDVSGVPEVQTGERVTVYDETSLPELSALAGTIPYELLCAVSPRVPRLYLQAGDVIGTSAPLWA
ncbi:MAG: alanine racemase, partial [Alicyclobacillus sp.]|nr:alanine racemase [Alicyclobacillus sp.]